VPGARARDRMLRRIRESRHRLTVVYPPLRVAATGTAPAAVPLSPLTGPLQPQALIPPDPAEPTKPQVEGVPCLWYDVHAVTAWTDAIDRRQFNASGWRQGAHALACVAVDATAIDPDKPYGPTVFDDCDHLLHNETTYRIVELERYNAGDALPYLYYLWLATAVGQ
jgi:hypothetical protein